MAKVILDNIKKIYPHAKDEDKKKKKKKNNEPEKKTNLQITEEGVVAVQQFSLEIADKEFIVLVGPSGCGKSTTLRMIAGLEKITEGNLYIGEERVNDVAPKDRDIAMVFQNYALYPHMSVYDNMAFSLQNQKKSKEEIDARVREAAEILDITPLLDRKPKALSGGQRQRVAIGRAFVRDPKVFLMDEPLSNLDAKLRNQMRAEIIKLREKIDTTFVYVTHDQVEAMTLGDRIVIMKDGFIQQIGTPQEVFNHPQNLFVAGFIGVPQMNMFNECDLIKDGETYKVVILGKEYELTTKQSAALAANDVASQTITVGVRPVHVAVSQNPEDGLSASVEVTEMMGSELHIHMTTNEQKMIAVVPIDYNTDEVIEQHSTVAFDFKPVHMHLFSNETGMNLI